MIKDHTSIKDETSIKDKAGYYFENGFHCAEAVVVAVLEGLGKDASHACAHATSFGGGYGRTFEEACGALSGGLIVIGHLYGRNEPGLEWDIPAKLSANLRQTFIDRFENTHCATLRKRFGQEMQQKECCNIVKQVASDLVELLSLPTEDELKSCCNVCGIQ